MIAILSETIGAIGRTARTAAAVRRFAWHLTGLAPGRRLRLRQPLRGTPLTGWEKHGGAGTGRKRCCLACIGALLIAALAMASADARADEGTWVQVGANFGDGTYSSLAIDPATDQPYVAYSDTTENGQLTVKRFDGTNWMTVGKAGFSDSWPAYTSLAFDPASGQPYVAYGSGGNPGGKLSVKRFDGAAWVQVGEAVGTYGALGGKLAFEPVTNRPVVAYADATYDGLMATVIRWDGRNWVQVGPLAGHMQSHMVLSEGQISLAFDPASGQPYVAYQDADGDKATVKRFDGTNWVAVGPIGFSGSVVDDISLAFDPVSHQPVVAYLDHDTLGYGPFEVVLRRFDGTNWIEVGPAIEGRADYVTLAFSPASGQPYVAYEDQVNANDATVKRFDGTNWVNVGEPGFTDKSAVGLSFVFDPARSQPFAAVDYWSPAVFKFEATGLQAEAPQITRTETFREGVMVFFRVFFTDANGDASEFGFRGVKGSSWAEETHPFTDPSYGRVFPGRVEYPFNHGCGTSSEYESDVEVWIGDRAGLKSPPVTVHLACSAPGAPAATTRAMRGKARQWQARSLQVK